MKDSISVVIPVYNSTDSLADLCDKIFQSLGNYELEIIFVDDGSEGATWEQIKNIRKQFDYRVTALRLSKNFGQHNATICGLDHCHKDYVVTIDDDLQYLPEDIPGMLKKLKNDSLDLVYGLPKVKKQNPIRLLGALLLSFFFSLFNEKVSKASSFRIMKKELADKVKLHKQYFVNVDAFVRWYTKSIGYCEVTHYSRKKHRSGYTALDLVSVVSRAIIAYSAVPLKLFVFSLITAVLVGAFILFSYLSGFDFLYKFFPLVVWTSVSLFTFGFVMLFAYLFHLTSFLNNKPCYNIVEKI